MIEINSTGSTLFFYYYSIFYVAILLPLVLLHCYATYFYNHLSEKVPGNDSQGVKNFDEGSTPPSPGNPDPDDGEEKTLWEKTKKFVKDNGYYILGGVVLLAGAVYVIYVLTQGGDFPPKGGEGSGGEKPAEPTEGSTPPEGVGLEMSEVARNIEAVYCKGLDPTNPLDAKKAEMVHMVM